MYISSTGLDAESMADAYLPLVNDLTENRIL